jgi:hypothetical protein
VDSWPQLCIATQRLGLSTAGPDAPRMATRAVHSASPRGNWTDGGIHTTHSAYYCYWCFLSRSKPQYPSGGYPGNGSPNSGGDDMDPGHPPLR